MRFLTIDEVNEIAGGVSKKEYEEWILEMRKQMHNNLPSYEKWVELKDKYSVSGRAGFSGVLKRLVGGVDTEGIRSGSVGDTTYPSYYNEVCGTCHK